MHAWTLKQKQSRTAVWFIHFSLPPALPRLRPSGESSLSDHALWNLPHTLPPCPPRRSCCGLADWAALASGRTGTQQQHRHRAPSGLCLPCTCVFRAKAHFLQAQTHHSSLILSCMWLEYDEKQKCRYGC